MSVGASLLACPGPTYELWQLPSAKENDPSCPMGIPRTISFGTPWSGLLVGIPVLSLATLEFTGVSQERALGVPKVRLGKMSCYVQQQ